MGVRAVIFDCDGVILDTYRHFIRNFGPIIEQYGLEWGEKQRALVIEHFGGHGAGFLVKCFNISWTLAEEIYAEWERLDSTRTLRVVRGARKTVHWCRENELIACMVTSRYLESLTPALKRIGLGDAFWHINTPDNNRHPKPDPLVFEPTLQSLSQEFGITRDDCIFIGDTKVDIQAGHEADIRTLVVATGPYHDGHKHTHPVHRDRVLPNINHLPRWILSQAA